MLLTIIEERKIAPRKKSLFDVVSITSMRSHATLSKVRMEVSWCDLRRSRSFCGRKKGIPLSGVYAKYSGIMLGAICGVFLSLPAFLWSVLHIWRWLRLTLTWSCVTGYLWPSQEEERSEKKKASRILCMILLRLIKRCIYASTNLLCLVRVEVNKYT